MERKIGEIFEFGGEWYQCVKSPDGSCKHCDMNFGGKCPIPIKECIASSRIDLSYVIFKKLEKVGEPYVKRVSDGTFSKFQRYKVYNSVVLPKEPYIYCNFIDSTVEIEIKQTKEDMEGNRTINQQFAECEQTINDVVRKCYTENKSTQIKDMEENKTTFPKENNALTRTVYAYVNEIISDKELIKLIKEMPDEYPYGKNELKPFDLESAKAGKPVCTRDGRKARIICFDAKKDMPIVALITNKDIVKNKIGDTEEVHFYYEDGRCNKYQEYRYDLMMLPEKKEGWVNIYYEHDAPSHREASWVYDKEEEAIKVGKEHGSCYIATVRIEWEE